MDELQARLREDHDTFGNDFNKMKDQLIYRIGLAKDFEEIILAFAKSFEVAYYSEVRQYIEYLKQDGLL